MHLFLDIFIGLLFIAGLLDPRREVRAMESQHLPRPPQGSDKQLYCPVCCSQDRAQPLLSPMQLLYQPLGQPPVRERYRDETGNPEFRYKCMRCFWEEIYVKQPV